MKSNERKELEGKICSFILENSNGPGSKIDTETQLAKRFNVSRYQVRNVLNGLVQQGVITKTPGRGTVINKIDTKTISSNIGFNYRVSNLNLYESIEARIVIEVASIPLIVKRITPSRIVDLEACVKTMRDNKMKPQVADEADMNFHITLFKASGNQLLATFSQIVIQLFMQADYRQKYWNTQTIERLAEEHEAILSAIQDGDVELSIQRMKKHLDYTNRIVLNGLRNDSKEKVNQ